MSENPKKCGRKSTSPHIIKKFIAFVEESNNSEPADSGTAPMFVSKNVKAPVRRLMKPIDEIINNYQGNQCHNAYKRSSILKRKLRNPQPKRIISYNSRSNLRNYIPKNIKNAKRHTGRCPHCKEHATLTNRLMQLCDGEFVFPLHGQCIDIPSKTEREDMVALDKQNKFNNLLGNYLALDKHIRRRIRIRKLRKRRKKNNYPLDLLEVTIDAKEPIILGKGKDETSNAVFDYIRQ